MIKRMTTILAAMALAHLASAATRCADATGGDGEKALAADGTVRPAALTGNPEEIKAMVFDITSKYRVVAEKFPGSAGGLAVADYPKYALVAILDSTKGFGESARWATPAACAAVRDYLAKGGTVIVNGGAVKEVAAQSASARELIRSGRVITNALAIFRLRFTYAAAGKSLGEADEKGVYALTPEGEEVAALDAFYAKAFTGAKGLDRSAEPNEWEAKPLGPVGRMTHETTFARKPKLRAAPPVRREGLVLYDGATKAVIVAPKKASALRALAKELAWHFEKMTGAAFAVVDQAPASGPAVVLKFVPGPLGHMVVRREGNALVLGGESSGVSHAVTYLLESLGCRYLWPGKLGKVIPKRDRLVAPDVALDETPALKIRLIRDPAKVDKTYKDHPGNRGFFAWHGVNDARNMKGWYGWGHYFGDYYQRYFDAHPDWFALQPYGGRAQDLASRPERPTLCLSSEGLADQAAANILADFRRSPTLAAHSICLPDGGNPTECMCRRCRALDPPNGAKVRFRVTEPWHRSFSYVSFTDRVMTFNNRIAERVTAVMPEKKLTCYVYSNYVHPPLLVKPHPALVLLSVAGSYTSERRRGWARENLAAWSRFGNEMLWRPNALIGFRAAAPQNFAREIFNDLEVFKANGVIGTDFDCMADHWSGQGLIYYAVAKAHLNVDALGYDAVFDDYCTSGFGRAAAAVKGYFLALENTLRTASRAENPESAYLKLLDVDRLEAMLADGRRAAAGDADVCARIDFLAKALVFARYEKKVYAAWETKDNATILAAQKEFNEACLRPGAEDPLVYRYKSFSSSYAAPMHRRPRF